ncbi:MAG: transglutaminase-like cysteine peptidase [Alphaproteobacteria bacterium]
MKRYLGFWIVAAALAGSLPSAYARSSAGGSPNVATPGVATENRMVEAGRVMAPIAHIIHCQTYRAECRKSRTRGPIRLDAARWRQLQTVNRHFNRTIAPASDKNLHATIDVWSVGGQFGDCEDYAIAKRSTLIASGWPASAVVLAMVRNQPGAGHLVAVVRTNRGDFVLDNLTLRIRRWDRTGYIWVKQQSAKDPHIWVQITKAPPQSMVALKIAWIDWR